MPRNRYRVVIVLLTFFVISLVTNILGPIVPDIISSFHVNLTAAGLYVCDASVFLNCPDKTTTLSILAFTFRTSEYLVQQCHQGDH
jgi:hypothetical protein